MKESTIVLLLITVMPGKALTGASGAMSPDELLKNPPGKIHVFSFLPQKYLVEREHFLPILFITR